MKKIALFLSLVMVLSLLTACGGSKGEASVQSVSMICGMGGAGLVDRFAGMVTPQGETQIKANENATVDQILVKVGDSVIVGQGLFSYDMEQANLDLEKAKLELEKLKNTQTSLEEQKADTEKLMIGADSETQRQYALDIRELDANILQAKYDISVKNKEIEKLANTVKNVTVTSPVEGVVQSVNEPGATDDMGNPLPLMTIVETGGYRVKGYVNESNAYSLSEGMEVLLRSRVSEEVWHGTVTEIDWSSPTTGGSNNYYGDMDTQQSSKYPFYVALDGTEGLLLGQHLYIEPDYGQDTVEDANTIRLPAMFLCDIEGSPYVWAQGKNEKLEKRSVTLGKYDADMDTYVIESGLTADDYIAFPDDTLCTGMTCVTYDESDFSGEGDYAGDGTMVDGGITDDNSSEDIMPLADVPVEDSTVTKEAAG